MTLSKLSVHRSTPFFQIDFDPEFGVPILSDLPETFKNRLIITFTVDTLPENNLKDLKNWMTSKWAGIPHDGQLAFVNTLIAFFRRQTVILGESGYHIAEKVFFDWFFDKPIAIKIKMSPSFFYLWIFFKINNHFSKVVIFNVLIKQMGLKLQFIDEPMAVSFIDPFDSNLEERTLIKFNFHFPRFNGDEIKSFPKLILS